MPQGFFLSSLGLSGGGFFGSGLIGAGGSDFGGTLGSCFCANVLAANTQHINPAINIRFNLIITSCGLLMSHLHERAWGGEKRRATRNHSKMDATRELLLSARQALNTLAINTL